MGHKDESDSSFLQISADLPWDYVTTLHTSVSKETVSNIASSVNTEPTPTSTATNLVIHVYCPCPVQWALPTHPIGETQVTPAGIPLALIDP